MNRLITLFVIISLISSCFLSEEKNKNELIVGINKEIEIKPSSSGSSSELVSFANIIRLGAFRFPNIPYTDFAEGKIDINSDNDPLTITTQGLPQGASFNLEKSVGSRFLAQTIVSTEVELQNAVNNLRSGGIITIQPGIYNLTNSLYLPNGLTNVIIQGATGNHNDIVLAGKGMTDNSGTTLFGIHSIDTQGLKIGHLTIKDIRHHAVQLNPGVNSPHIYNVRMVDIGSQFVKANPFGYGDGVDNGIVEHSIMEYTTTAPDDYTNGVDVHGGANWIIRNNTFRNIRAPAGQLAGPAILMWNGSTNTLTENNLFLNIQRGISYGLIDRSSNDHVGGIIRNNFFYRSSSQSGDIGISVADSPNTRVLNNTVIMSGTYFSAIEYRFSATTNVEITNNLTDGIINSRDDGSATVSNNVTNAQAFWFVDVANSNLHIKGTVTQVIDRAISLADVVTDYDGESRRTDNGPDIGADEYHDGSASTITH